MVRKSSKYIENNCPHCAMRCFDINIPTAKEISDLLDIGQKNFSDTFQSILGPPIALNRTEKVFPLCDASFQSPK